MVALKVMLFLVCIAISQAAYLKGTDTADKVYDFLACLKKNMINGNPDIDLPTFSPLIQGKDVVIIPIDLDIAKFGFSVTNVNWTGIDNFDVKLTQKSEDDASVTELDFVLQWPFIKVLGIYANIIKVGNLDLGNSGNMFMNLTNAVWTGTINFTKEKVEKLTIKSSVENASVDVDNTEEWIRNLFDSTFNRLWETLFDSKIYSSVVSRLLQGRFTEEWLQKPERIQKLLASC